jgi:uncharacterized protein
MTLGHVSAMLLICKSGWLPGVQRHLAAVGQMAFSNNIAHSVIYGFVFYGCGVFSLVASPMWLEHYRFGPLEWCWRSLTYWKKQPMRLVVETAPEEAITATA